MAYVTPVTTEYESTITSGAHFDSWYLFREPILPAIAQFCRTHLLWSQPTLGKKLTTHLFPSVVLRMLYSPISGFNRRTNRLLGPTLYVTINNATWKTRKGRFRLQYGSLPQPRFTVSIGSLLQLSGVEQPANPNDAIILVWASRDNLPHGLNSVAMVI
ncbi:hypothetical protein BJ165DRAFT_1525021 [Panaeolus papilionaceus]|nr:hypothetical protein BJ165DRAFT_1525021 [Panaeolus papilionaceus]